MYPPPHIVDNSSVFIARLMHAYGFAALTTMGNNELLCTHIPLIFRESEGQHGTLYGHIAKNNPQSAHLDGKHNAMAVFSGPHAYISASWYENPEMRVPTWNYESIQASGKPEIVEAEKWPALMDELISKYEPDEDWTSNKAQDYVDRLMNGIIYFKMKIIKITAIRKMYDKNPINQDNVITQLTSRGETAAANAMRAHPYHSNTQE